MSFIEGCLDKLTDFVEGQLIWGGDLNVALDPLLDTSTGSSHLSYVALHRIKKALMAVHLVHTWRIAHRDARNYTFFSPPHNSYLRLDYFLVHQSALPLVTSSSIGVRSLSKKRFY